MAEPELNNEQTGGRSEAALAHGSGEQLKARSFAQFIQFLEDGQLHGDLTSQLQQISEELSGRAFNTDPKRKHKGKLTLTLDFTLEGGVFEIVGKSAVKLPEDTRPKSIMWADQNNVFTPQNPKQFDMWASGPRAT